VDDHKIQFPRSHPPPLVVAASVVAALRATTGPDQIDRKPETAVLMLARYRGEHLVSIIILPLQE
jgi:hypothetical protein